MPQYLELTRPGSYICVAEIDPAVTDAAFKAFGLKENTGIDIRNIDARNAVDDLIQARKRGEDVPAFDYVLGDSINNKAIPFHLTTREFNESLASLLSDDGFYLFHVIDSLASGAFIGSVYDTVRETFPYVSVLSLDEDILSRGTFMLVCSKKPHDVSAVPQMIRERHERYAGRKLSAAELEILDAKSNGMILTDSYAPVDNLIKALVKDDKSDLCEKYLEKSIKALGQGEIARSIELLNRLIEVQPRYEAAYRQLAQCYEAQGDVARALATLDEVLKLNSDYVEARILKGAVLARKGELEQAVKQWQSVLEDRPGNVDARNNIGVVWAHLGDVRKAVGEWDQTLKISPNDSTAHYYLGKFLFKLGDIEGATWHSKQAALLDPGLTRSVKNILPKKKGNVQQYMEQLLF